jgi:hypothetical protein
VTDKPDPRRAAAELSASSADTVAAALAELEGAITRRPVVPVAMPGAGVLGVFGSPPPEEIAAALIEVILHYPLFKPLVDTKDRLAEALDVALAFGPGRPAYDVARFVRAEDDPSGTVDELMFLLLDADVEDAHGLDAMGQILDVLLDARHTHDAVVRGLEQWAFRGRYSDVIDDLGTALSGSDREGIRLQAE